MKKIILASAISTCLLASLQNGVQNFPGSWGKER